MRIEIKTKQLILSSLESNDLQALQKFEARNHAHLQNWGNRETEREKIASWVKDCEEGRSVRFIIKTQAMPDQIIGMCNFTQIFYGPFRACYLGYKIDKDFEGQGLMFETLEAAIRYIFENVKLHRIMAAYMPINIRSAKLLSRLNFAIEGYAKNYLLINDKWEDHVLTALSLEQWQLQCISK